MEVLAKRKAFTLAEVLITLGIIGIVAAMTIPSLMNNIQDKQFREAAKEAYSRASQAVNQMKQDNGGDISYYRNTALSFKPVFMSYFKVAQDCGWSNCVADSASSTVYKYLHGEPAYTHYMAMGQFVTTDGMLWAIRNSGYLFITVDVNGYTKGPNTFGKDTFMFDLTNTDTLLPMGASNTTPYAYPGEYCDRTLPPAAGTGFNCMYKVINNIDY